MIDELAALTAYCPERDLQRRAEMAINLLCSQGRAPGFTVFACLQDPRKEVIPSRGLFTQMVGLRLKDMPETGMVLGDAAVASGAHCHRITRSHAGDGLHCAGGRWIPGSRSRRTRPRPAIRSAAKPFRDAVSHQAVIVPTATAAGVHAQHPPPRPRGDRGWRDGRAGVLDGSLRSASAVPDLPGSLTRSDVGSARRLADEALSAAVPGPDRCIAFVER